MNIIVHCPAEMTYLLFQDASSTTYDDHYIYKFTNWRINEVGIESIVQIVIDNTLNNMAETNTLLLTHLNIFWISYAVHTVNLMLLDIRKLNISEVLL